MSRHAAGRVLLAVSLLLGALAFLPVSGGPAVDPMTYIRPL